MQSIRVLETHHKPGKAYDDTRHQDNNNILSYPPAHITHFDSGFFRGVDEKQRESWIPPLSWWSEDNLRIAFDDNDPVTTN